MKDDIIDRLEEAAEVLKSFGAKEVYVFGSVSEGRGRTCRDVDMAVSGLPPEVFFVAMGHASDVLRAPMDLIDLDEGGPFVEHLKRNKKLDRVA